MQLTMIDEMLEKAIEIEGLIRIVRDGEPTEEVYGLLKRKVKELLEDLEPGGRETRGPEGQGGRVPMGQEIGEMPEAAVEMEEEADAMMGFAEEEETEAEGKDADEERTSDEDDIMLFLDEEESGGTEKDTIDKTKIASSIGDRQIHDIKNTGNLKSYFSLNDRFLYSRELFNNNMKAFDSTLKSLEGVKDFSVIEDYFYNELDWDRENPTVKSFMEKLRDNAQCTMRN